MSRNKKSKNQSSSNVRLMNKTNDRLFTKNTNPLILRLKYKYYNMVCDGEKTAEYREYKPYWISRIKDQKELIIVPGYGNCNSLDIKAKIDSINIIEYPYLPEHAMIEFHNSKYDKFFEINFTVV